MCRLSMFVLLRKEYLASRRGSDENSLWCFGEGSILAQRDRSVIISAHTGEECAHSVFS